MEDFKKERESGIELLKIIAIFLIVISHISQTYGSMHSGLDSSYFIDSKIATENIQNIIILTFIFFGSIGNSIFFISTAWFLIDKKDNKKKKILQMLLEVWIISLIILSIFLLFRINITKIDILKCLLPTTLSLNWYITCYLLFYAIYPYINQIIERMSKKQLLTASIVLSFLYIFMNTIKYGLFFGCEIIFFIVIYFDIAYFKKYLINISNNKKINRAVFVISSCLLLLLIICTNFLGLKINFLKDKMLHFATNSNPIVYLIAFSLFNLFRSKKFTSKSINYISKLSIYMYIIHDNFLFRSYIRPYLFVILKDTFGYTYIVGWILLFSLVLFILSLIISCIYKVTLYKIVIKISDKIYDKLKNAYNKISNELLKLN